MLNDLGISYSLKTFIEENMGVETYIKNDGFQYPDEKPFIVVEGIMNVHDSISKQRESIETNFAYRVSIHAEKSYKLATYQTELRVLFLHDIFPYYNEMGDKTDKRLSVEGDFTETLLKSDDISNKTEWHRVYFDVEIVATSHKGR